MSHTHTHHSAAIVHHHRNAGPQLFLFSCFCWGHKWFGPLLISYYVIRLRPCVSGAQRVYGREKTGNINWIRFTSSVLGIKHLLMLASCDGTSLLHTCRGLLNLHCEGVWIQLTTGGGLWRVRVC